MGQQQLILVTIIVGIATLIALNILSQRQIQSNRDAVRQDLVQAASYVQSIWERPSLMEGAGKDFSSMDENIILRFINVPSSSFQEGDTEAINENGTYRINDVDEMEMTIIGEPDTGPPNLQISVIRDPETGNWDFEISEVGEDDSGGGGGGPQRGTDSQRLGRF